MPKLSARALSELIGLPAYEQVRILAEQKYPRRQPQSFRIPYYATALKGIRDYFKAGRTQAALLDAKRRAMRIQPESRRNHNLRVLDLFKDSDQSKRLLSPIPLTNYNTILGSLELTLRFDLVGNERRRVRRILYNTRVAPIGEEIARTTLDVAHWVMEKTGDHTQMQDLQYVDLPTGEVYSWTRRRKTTIRKIRRNVQIIDTLWPTI